MTLAGVGASSAALDYEYGPVAVVLDFMNSVSAFGRLVGQAGELRRDKSQGGKGGTRCFSKPTRNCESLGSLAPILAAYSIVAPR